MPAAKTQKQLLEEIHRGLYGDEANEVVGLIARQGADEVVRAEHEKRIAALETWRKNTMWVLTGVWALLTSILPWKKIILFFQQLS